MLVYSVLLMKSRKKLACDVTDTVDTHVGFIYDVTSTGCWVQDGSTHGQIFTTFKRQFVKTRTRRKSKESCCVYTLH